MSIWQHMNGFTADNGRVPTNMAGIDLTIGCAKELGLPKEWKGELECQIIMS